eukprot:1116311-Prorocentrum_minimum.AAC.1
MTVAESSACPFGAYDGATLDSHVQLFTLPFRSPMHGHCQHATRTSGESELTTMRATLDSH